MKEKLKVFLKGQNILIMEIKGKFKSSIFYVVFKYTDVYGKNHIFSNFSQEEIKEIYEYL